MLAAWFQFTLFQRAHEWHVPKFWVYKISEDNSDLHMATVKQLCLFQNSKGTNLHLCKREGTMKKKPNFSSTGGADFCYISVKQICFSSTVFTQNKISASTWTKKVTFLTLEIVYIYYSIDNLCILLSLPCHLFMTVTNTQCYQVSSVFSRDVWPDKSRNPATVWINPQKRSSCLSLEMSVHWVCKYDDDKLTN